MQPVLIVNLTEGVFDEYKVPESWARDFLGGASLAARMLYDQLVPGLDPLSPEAPLLFLNGPLTGTAGPSLGRFVICGLSPATRLWGESNCGGFWGPELRMAGFDGILLIGRSHKPVYLWIHGGGDEPAKCELRSASHLWGLETYQTQGALRDELGVKNLRVASIGPAGESFIPFASILCDHGRVAGRTGMGAIMGLKNLKAIAVKGKGAVPVARPEVFMPIRAAANRSLREDNVSRTLHELGTAGPADYFDYLGDMPKRYFQHLRMDEELKVTGASIKESILVGETTCHACVIACGRVVRVNEDDPGGPVDGWQDRKGPEYETLVGFGPNLSLNDPLWAAWLGELCDRYGMDTISMSNTLGLAFALFEHGIIDEKDTGDLELRWGDAPLVEELIHLTARREGFGAYLAEGARSLGRRFGAEDMAMQVNGLEVAYHDPRGCSGMALVYATSPRGACHNQSDYYLVDMGGADQEIGIQYYPHQAGAEKAANVARHQDWRTIFNSLVLCFLANVQPLTVLELINSACGLDWDIPELLKAGERGWNLKRAINNRLGLTRANDKLPKGLLLPYQDDPEENVGKVPDMDAMLSAYYLARDWDLDTGIPKPAKLDELGLGWLVEELWSNLVSQPDFSRGKR